MNICKRSVGVALARLMALSMTRGDKCRRSIGVSHTHRVLVVCLLLGAAAGPSDVAAAATTSRVNVDSTGVPGSGLIFLFRFVISADGRFVAFDSSSDNLVPGDTNDRTDVFVHDRQTGQTTRVSVGAGGAQANLESSGPAISAEGRFVAFESAASNLVPGDTNGTTDIFVHDRQTGQTTRVSVASGGAQANGNNNFHAISADGRFVVFVSDATNLVPGDTNGDSDIFVHDRQTRQTTRVSVGAGGAQANSGSNSPAISADGRFVAFSSFASNLVPGDTNGTTDIFVHDRQTGQTTRVSVASSGAQANSGGGSPSISADGRFVAFDSFASNLVPGDTNGTTDIFMHDRQTGQTTRVSVGAGGAQANLRSDRPAISADGRSVAFQSSADNLVAMDTNDRVDIFVRGPLLPGIGAGLTLSGAATGASFFGGVSADDGATFASVFSENDVVDITASMHVDPDDVGTMGSLHIVIGVLGKIFYQEASGGLQEWDLNPATLGAVSGPRMLETIEDLTIFNNLPLTGIGGISAAIIVGYTDAAGDIHFHPVPIGIAVSAP